MGHIKKNNELVEERFNELKTMLKDSEDQAKEQQKAQTQALDAKLEALAEMIREKDEIQMTDFAHE